MHQEWIQEVVDRSTKSEITWCKLEVCYGKFNLREQLCKHAVGHDWKITS